MIIVISTINIIFYIFMSYFLIDHFIDESFFQSMGGAEYGFLALISILIFWVVMTSYGLALSKAWVYRHALRLNTIIILVLSIKLFLGIYNNFSIDLSYISIVCVVIFLIFTCFVYSGKKVGVKGSGDKCD